MSQLLADAGPDPASNRVFLQHEHMIKPCCHEACLMAGMHPRLCCCSDPLACFEMAGSFRPVLGCMLLCMLCLPSTLSAAQGMTSATEQLSICCSMIDMLEATCALGLSHKLTCAATGSEHACEGRHLATCMHFHRQANSCPSNRLQSPSVEQQQQPAPHPLTAGSWVQTPYPAQLSSGWCPGTTQSRQVRMHHPR